MPSRTPGGTRTPGSIPLHEYFLTSICIRTRWSPDKTVAAKMSAFWGLKRSKFISAKGLHVTKMYTSKTGTLQK